MKGQNTVSILPATEYPLLRDPEGTIHTMHGWGGDYYNGEEYFVLDTVSAAGVLPLVYRVYINTSVDDDVAEGRFEELTIAQIESRGIEVETDPVELWISPPSGWYAASVQDVQFIQ